MRQMLKRLPDISPYESLFVTSIHLTSFPRKTDLLRINSETYTKYVLKIERDETLIPESFFENILSKSYPEMIKRYFSYSYFINNKTYHISLDLADTKIYVDDYNEKDLMEIEEFKDILIEGGNPKDEDN